MIEINKNYPINSKNSAKLFSSDVIKWKKLASKFWSIIFVFFFILAHSVTASSPSLFNDFGTMLISSLFTNIFSFKYWLYASLISMFFWLTFSFNDSLFRITPRVYSSNYDKIAQILCSLECVNLIWSFISSLCICYSLLQLYNDEYYKQLNLIYIIGFCGLSTTYMRLKFMFNENYLFEWPIIEQTKYVRFKSKAFNVCLYTFKAIISTLAIWQIIYLLMGLTSSSFGLLINNHSTNINKLNFFTGLFGSFLAAIKISFIINFSYLINWYLLEIYMTEVYHFTLQQTISTELISLPTAMSLYSYPYIQTLAIIDLNYLSVNSKAARKQLFSLDFKNGQPTYWIKVSNEALNIINNFMDIFNFDDMLHGSGKLFGNTAFENSPRLITNLPVKRVNLTSPFNSPLRQASQNIYEERTYLKSPQTIQSGILPNKFTIKCNTLREKISNSFVCKKFIDKIKSQTIFQLIFNQNSNYKTEQLFVDSFLVTNSLKALSNLAIASFNEDEYGIVQQTLPQILTTFINLQKMLEKFLPSSQQQQQSSNQSTNISFKIIQKTNPGHVQLLIQKLSFILNESIYKIVITFGITLKSLALSDEVTRRLDRYYF